MHELKQQVIELCAPILDWCTALGEPGLFILAFIEASFFLLPPELLLTPMVIREINDPYILAMVTTIGSVMGAVFGYYIGLFGGRPLALKMLSKKADFAINKAEAFFGKFGSAAILIAAFTPIPYKVFTITAGMCKMNIVSFILYSLLGRGSRYLIFTYLLVNYGEIVLENFFKYALIAAIIYALYELIRWRMK